MHIFFFSDIIQLYSLMKRLCILLVLLTYVYHDARFTKHKEWTDVDMPLNFCAVCLYIRA